jgi:hypothetical protein
MDRVYQRAMRVGPPLVLVLLSQLRATVEPFIRCDCGAYRIDPSPPRRGLDCKPVPYVANVHCSIQSVCVRAFVVMMIQ